MIAPPKNTTLVDWVEGLIIKDIRDNEMTTGTEIPNELELAEKYDVGRNVVREALSRLRMLGIIESRKRRGMVIAEPNVMYGFQKVINPHMLSKDTILDLLGMRVSLEIGCASIIIHNITDQDIAELKQIVSKEDTIDSLKVNIEMERAFHSKIYTISKNRVMLDFLNIIIPVFKYVNENFEYFDRFNKLGTTTRRYVRHRDLIPYLEARDVEGYQKAVQDHLIAYVDYINNFNESGKAGKNKF
jgi:GntR family transcriptional repressor for pyruvate dehydrogenase complex